MEVHAHTHTARKKWTHYFWEFLMLFLAVFCGFFAEYKLEQTIETHRAKEFALSLYSDLAADTVEFNQTSNALAYCANKIDTLVDLLNDQNELKKNSPAIYFTSLYAFIFPVYSPNESTIQQLLNSGSLRYFKNKEMVEKIKKYNLGIHFVKQFANTSDNLNLEFRKIQLQIIELAPIVNYLNSGNLEYDSISYKEKAVYFSDSKLLTGSNSLLKEYANWCNLKKFYFQNTISDYAAIKSDAKTVLNMIKKEYHLE